MLPKNTHDYYCYHTFGYYCYHTLIYKKDFGNPKPLMIVCPFPGFKLTEVAGLNLGDDTLALPVQQAHWSLQNKTFGIVVLVFGDY